jgi:hypothetical protein
MIFTFDRRLLHGKKPVKEKNGSPSNISSLDHAWDAY